MHLFPKRHSFVDGPNDRHFSNMLFWLSERSNLSADELVLLLRGSPYAAPVNRLLRIWKRCMGARLHYPELAWDLALWRQPCLEFSEPPDTILAPCQSYIGKRSRGCATEIKCARGSPGPDSTMLESPKGLESFPMMACRLDDLAESTIEFTRGDTMTHPIEVQLATERTFYSDAEDTR
ncbi:hypothetical protein BKA67DRAFT_533787 [Truncatella angustata]|uniref:Uncharacterized protein n=1 Tax=Truncatella angustata TaxID=152316 RepID=A0A9P8UUC2_9PEZI|nr:uncharacterized protein BKA67DRAFT_533787 [Truncatella angustata]KAH6658662.1 hypothetical protein BKA67DRAFT_533787 [Truncatella angustata]